MAALLLFALVLSPADAVQEETVRMMYVHVPTAIVAFTAFFVTAGRQHRLPLEALGVVGPRPPHASAEIGAVLLGATLVTGMLWGRVTWGVYWTWDARLTTTALLFLFVLGYLAVRRLPIERDRRSRLAAVVGLLARADHDRLPLRHDWWRTLHQGPTISRLDPQIDGLMLFTLMLGMVVFALLYAWLLIHRFRVLWLENRIEDLGLDLALAERRREATDGGPLVTTS